MKLKRRSDVVTCILIVCALYFNSTKNKFIEPIKTRVSALKGSYNIRYILYNITKVHQSHIN